MPSEAKIWATRLVSTALIIAMIAIITAWTLTPKPTIPAGYPGSTAPKSTFTIAKVLDESNRTGKPVIMLFYDRTSNTSMMQLLVFQNVRQMYKGKSLFMILEVNTKYNGSEACEDYNIIICPTTISVLSNYTIYKRHEGLLNETMLKLFINDTLAVQEKLLTKSIGHMPSSKENTCNVGESFQPSNLIWHKRDLNDLILVREDLVNSL